MKTGKEIMIDYCITVESNNIEYLESCEDVLHGLNKNDYTYLDGHCPSASGLDNYKGLCFIDSIPSCFGKNEEQEKQCNLCWKIAIEKEFD